MSAYAKRELERLGVEVLLNQKVEVRREEGAFVGDMLIPCATMIWAAGVTVPHFKDWLPAQTDRTGASPSNPICRFQTIRRSS